LLTFVYGRIPFVFIRSRGIIAELVFDNLLFEKNLQTMVNIVSF